MMATALAVAPARRGTRHNKRVNFGTLAPPLLLLADLDASSGSGSAPVDSTAYATAPTRGASAETWRNGLSFEALPSRRRRGDGSTLTTGRARRACFASVSLATAPAVSAPPPPPAAAKVDTKPATDVIAGALARAASQSTIHPLDTLKVRLQAGKSAMNMAPPSSSGGLPAALNSLRHMYRGVLGAASGAGIAVGAYFLVYGVARNAIDKRTDMPAGARAFVAGGIAAAGSSVVKVPIAVCIRSVQAGVYPNAIQAARSIVASAGLRGLFTGYVPTLVEDVPDMAVKFAVYETLQGSYSRMFGRRPSGTEDFFMGALAGAMAAAATTPFDVVKTSMMCSAASRPSLRASFRAVAAQGPHALFRGVGPRALSSGVNSAVFFCFFEMLRTNFKRQQSERAAMESRVAAGREPELVAA